MAPRYVAPYLDSDAFNCPHCEVYAHQEWGALFLHLQKLPGYPPASVDGFRAARCEHCKKFSVWWYGGLLFPEFSAGVPAPSQDMPYDIQLDYTEAARILSKSPRGSAALSRLAIQKLCKHLGKSGRDLNDDIADLVTKGLPAQIQQALDIVRVIGNNAVHPGQIDLRDDQQIAQRLFELVNLIVDHMLTKPRQISEMYERLPQSNLEAIKRRDEAGS